MDHLNVFVRGQIVLKQVLYYDGKIYKVKFSFLEYIIDVCTLVLSQ